MGDMRQCLRVEGGRNCPLILQPTQEEWLGEGRRYAVEVAKPDKSWEGKWNEHAGG